MLPLLGIGGAFGVFASGLPTGVQLPLAVCAVLWSLVGAWREHRRPPRVFMVRSDQSAILDDMPLHDHHVHWRGPLAFLRARDGDGRVHRLAFWPDVLGARGRRALRLSSPSLTGPLAAQPHGMRG
ncbi:hypothetical protein [Noviluteimonas dokdonensis]|uniref:hypothetical protein n=1 Tax=Noviluteimonas dokdonensis TaxID=414050 RepID=UPI000689F997|nr:hypothetical protein [Lysobacter dokdonensis]